MRKALCTLLAAVLLSGCGRPGARPVPSGSAPLILPTDGPRHPWTHLAFNNDPQQFQFAIVGDRTGRHRPGVFEKGIEKLNLLRPEFVMTVGDLIEGYTKDQSEIAQQWDEIEGFTAKLQAPFFYVPGNHDLSNAIQAGAWRDRFGPAYYHFVYRDVLFLCLNTSDPEQRISSAQIEYVARTLKENAGARWTCVFMHEPLYKKETGWVEVEKLLGERQYTVFAGHYHTYTKYIRNDRRYLVLATTGGGMKQGLDRPELGSFDHLTWVTMLPDGPRVANLELNGIFDENVRTEASANLINRVLNGNALEIGPILERRERFGRAAVTLTFRNDAQIPMRARGAIPANGPLRAAPEKFDVTVAPASTAAVSIELKAESPAALAKLPAMAVEWTANFAPGGSPAVEIPRRDILAVEPLFSCPRRAGAVVVDGQLDEWADLPHAYEALKSGPVEGWGGASDSAYRFAIAHDDQFVYIAVKTSDDRPVLNPLKEPWSQDGIEVRLDARAEPQRSQGRGRGEFKDILVVSMSPGRTREEMVFYSADQLPPGVRAVCVKTDTGHAMEIAIPAKYLDEKQGGPWKAFRLNIVVNDFDQVAGPLRALWWRPDWRSAQTFAGSGTFERK